MNGSDPDFVCVGYHFVPMSARAARETLYLTAVLDSDLSIRRISLWGLNVLRLAQLLGY